MMAFFFGRIIICQKDIVENPLKTLVLKKKWEIFPNKDTIKFHQGNINKRLKKWKPY